MTRRGRGMKVGKEHQEQVKLMSWANNTRDIQTDPMKHDALEWLHAIPSGGGRGKPFVSKSGREYPPFEAVKLKAEGVKPGVFDLRLDYVVRNAHDIIIWPGLIIEMKYGRNTLSDKQRDYGKFMKSQGFAVFTRWSWWEAALDIAGYMRLDQFSPVLVESAASIIIIRNLAQLESYQASCPSK